MSADPEALLRRVMQLAVKAAVPARLDGLRSLARLPPFILGKWNQSEAVNGWTLLFDVMTAKETEETSFRDGGQVDAVQAVLDAGIAVTMALPAFLAQPAFRSANPHHERLFRFLLETTHAHANGRLAALLRQCALPARCPDENWRKAIQRMCDCPTPQFAAQIAAAEAKHEARKRKAEAEAAATLNADSVQDGESSVSSVEGDQANFGHANQPTAPSKAKKQKKDTKPQPTTQELMQQLESMIGMDSVIDQVKSVILDQTVRKARANDPDHLPNADATMHLIFSGNPGTGKTTVARLVAEIYKSLGLLSRGTYTEVKQQDLQGAYLGQSEKKTKEVLKASIGGVLFFDEVPNLANPSSYGSVIVSTMLTYLEDHRDDLVVIAAGYSHGIDAFLRMDAGLRRRFPTIIHFADYEPTALVQIANYLCAKTKRYLTPAAKEKFLAIMQVDFERRDRIAGYGNGGDVRTMVEEAIKSVNKRLPMPLPFPLTDKVKEMMHAILPEDIQPLPRVFKPNFIELAAQDFLPPALPAECEPE